MGEGVSQRSRRAIEVCGVVQGVRFLPIVFWLASRLGLKGLSSEP